MPISRYSIQKSILGSLIYNRVTKDVRERIPALGSESQIGGGSVRDARRHLVRMLVLWIQGKDERYTIGKKDTGWGGGCKTVLLGALG